MIHKLPDDVLVTIIDRACSKPSEYLSLRNVNHYLYSIINNLSDLYEGDLNSYEEDITLICKKNTSVETFQWIFRNKIQFTLQNIKELIIYNRYDVFSNGFNYNHFLKIIFNRFYIYVDPHSDIFSYIETQNPLIIAGMYNRIGIIQLLLQGQENVMNPYLNMIPSLFDLSMKHNHKNILSYLINQYYPLISDTIQKKLNTIIHRISNCEDILFHLMINNKIKLSLKHWCSIIRMNYSDFFITYYPNDSASTQPLQQCIASNNIIIFNYIMKINENKICTKRFTNLILQGKVPSQDFIHNIVNNHLSLIDRDKNFIKLCIKSDINQDTVIALLHEGFIFDEEDMKEVLKKKKYIILEIMCYKRNN
tara:strand:+ start:5777 stop:6871 length:1095 start_codon:yes stop_codon:yes gene_type:complete